MAKQKEARETLTNNEIGTVMLRYFYERNKNATSSRGKERLVRKNKRRELKSSHGLFQQEIQSNLTYLISQGMGKRGRNREIIHRARRHSHSFYHKLLHDHCCGH
jgi:hypothetical protein